MNIAMRRAKLLILESASENKEKMSEGWLLWELMRILGYEKRTNLKIIGGSNRLLEELKNAEERFIHISAHGDFHQTRGAFLKTPRKGKVFSSDLVEYGRAGRDLKFRIWWHCQRARRVMLIW